MASPSVSTTVTLYPGLRASVRRASRSSRMIGCSVDDALSVTCDVIGDPQAATRAPHCSQKRLSAPSAAPQPEQAPASGKRAPQMEQNSASVSSRGPQVGQARAVPRMDVDGAEVAAERRDLTLAAIMASTSSTSIAD